MKQQMNLPYMQNYVEMSQYFTDKSRRVGIQNSFSGSCFIAGDSHEKNYTLTLVFNECAIFYFWDNVHLLKKKTIL